jgi:hypothetical protein
MNLCTQARTYNTRWPHRRIGWGIPYCVLRTSYCVTVYAIMDLQPLNRNSPQSEAGKRNIERKS